MSVDFVAVLAVIAIGIALVLAMAWQAHKRLSEMKMEAAVLIPALEAFKAANGVYPRWIDELVPRYMGMLPQLVSRRRLRYKVHVSGGEYVLCCRTLLAGAQYNSRDQQWGDEDFFSA